MAKQPTPQGISALLRKAGFTRSQTSRSGMIKGWTESSAGYRVGKYTDGTVSVQHMTGFARGDAAKQQREENLAAYTKAIEAAGWCTQRTGIGFSTALIVSAAKED